MFYYLLIQIYNWTENFSRKLNFFSNKYFSIQNVHRHYLFFRNFFQTFFHSNWIEIFIFHGKTLSSGLFKRINKFIFCLFGFWLSIFFLFFNYTLNIYFSLLAHIFRIFFLLPFFFCSSLKCMPKIYDSLHYLMFFSAINATSKHWLWKFKILKKT